MNLVKVTLVRPQDLHELMIKSERKTGVSDLPKASPLQSMLITQDSSLFGMKWSLLNAILTTKQTGSKKLFTKGFSLTTSSKKVVLKFLNKCSHKQETFEQLPKPSQIKTLRLELWKGNSFLKQSGLKCPKHSCEKETNYTTVSFWTMSQWKTKQQGVSIWT